jgi:hypothetical protein
LLSKIREFIDKNLEVDIKEAKDPKVTPKETMQGKLDFLVLIYSI